VPKKGLAHIQVSYTHNQLDVCQSGEMYNAQIVKAGKGMHWPQILHQTTGDKSQIGYHRPIPL